MNEGVARAYGLEEGEGKGRQNSMKTRRFRAISLFFMIAFLLLAVTGPVFAQPPQRFSEQIDHTVQSRVMSRYCGFPVFVNINGTFTITLFSDGSGQVVRELDGYHDAQFTWLAPTQGTSFSYPANGQIHWYYPEGGTIGAPATIIYTGFESKVPGESANAGRVVYEGVVVDVTPEGIPLVDPFEFEESSRHGNFNGGVVFFDDLCAALTPDSNATG